MRISLFKRDRADAATAPIRPGGNKIACAALTVLAPTAFALGALAAPASAAGSIDECLTDWHTIGVRTQTHYVRNDCDSGEYGFKIHSWSRHSQETSRCITVAPGETRGWKWTRGRGNFNIIGC